MSKLLQNQSYGLKMKFVKLTNDDDTIGVNVTVTCNHDIDRSLLSEIEEGVNVLLADYDRLEDYQARKKAEREQEKARLKEEAKQKALRDEYERNNASRKQPKEENKIKKYR